MEKLEKILELLEKSADSKLSAEEESLLKLMIESDAEAGHFAGTYKGLKESMSKSFHPDEEMLASFIMSEDSGVSENSASLLLSEKIRKHISSCPNCRILYDSLKKEYNDVNEYVTKRFSLTGSAEPKTSGRIFSIFNTTPVFRYAFAAMLLIGFSYIGLFTVSSLTTPDYVQQFLNDDEEFYVTRGRTSILFQKGLSAIENKNYLEAINYLNEDIKSHESDGSIFYTHYILGLTYLKDAGSDFLGLFRSFDKEKVSQAVYNLEKTLELNTSGNFNNINLDVNYYLGKSYLLLEDFVEARTHLRLVVNEKGGLYKDAEELLNSIPE